MSLGKRHDEGPQDGPREGDLVALESPPGDLLERTTLDGRGRLTDALDRRLGENLELTYAERHISLNLQII